MGAEIAYTACFNSLVSLERKFMAHVYTVLDRCSAFKSAK
jgi:hypothetical protein